MSLSKVYDIFINVGSEYFPSRISPQLVNSVFQQTSTYQLHFKALNNRCFTMLCQEIRRDEDYCCLIFKKTR